MRDDGKVWLRVDIGINRLFLVKLILRLFQLVACLQEGIVQFYIVFRSLVLLIVTEFLGGFSLRIAVEVTFEIEVNVFLKIINSRCFCMYIVLQIVDV